MFDVSDLEKDIKTKAKITYLATIVKYYEAILKAFGRFNFRFCIWITVAAIGKSISRALSRIVYNYGMKKYIAELLGTFTLALTVGLSLAGAFPPATPILAGLVLGLFVYTIGSISGTHINPAVTIGAWSIKKIGGKDALWYIIAQFIGAALAMFVVSKTVGMPHIVVTATWGIVLAELVGTFFFTFGIASVIYGKTPSDLSGVVIGGSLLLGIVRTYCRRGIWNASV